MSTNLNQRGFTPMAVISILVLGVVVGVYLVQHPIISKVNAYNTDTVYPKENALDNPPALMIANDRGAYDLLTESGMAAGYLVKINESEDEITINLEPQELTEEQAKEILNNADTYYLRTLMWLLLDEFSIPSHPINPWYALCSYVDQNKLSEVGAELTILASGEYLKCFDPPPTTSQFDPTSAHQYQTYIKPKATVLVKMMETLKLNRENKSLFRKATEFATDMVPVMGPTINAMRNPGSDVDQVAQDTIINTLSNILFPVAEKGVVGGGKSIISALASKMNGRFIIPYFRGTSGVAYKEFTVEAANANNRLKSSQNLIVKILSPKKILNNSGTRDIVIKSVGKTITLDMFRPDLTRVHGGLKPWARQYVLPLGNIEKAIIEAQEHFKILPDNVYDTFVQPLALYNSDGLTVPSKNPLKTAIFVRQSANKKDVIIHEILHFIQFLHKPGSHSAADFMVREGLTDWWLDVVIPNYRVAYTTEVDQIFLMLQKLGKAGVDGVTVAQYSVLSGDSRYFLNTYTRATGDNSMQVWFAKQYNAHRAQGLVPPLIFFQQLIEDENNTNNEQTQIDIPIVSPDTPPPTVNSPNCGNGEKDANCSASTGEEPALGNLSKSTLPKEVLVETENDQSFFDKIKAFFKKIWSNPLQVFTRSKAVHQATVPSELAPEENSDPISGFLGGSQGFYGVTLPKEVSGDDLEASEKAYQQASFPEEVKPITGQ